jgi:hypothetical protein
VSADARAIRVEQMASTLARLGVDVSALVRDAYAEGYRDGLAAARAERAVPPPPFRVTCTASADDDVVERRPTTV